MGLSSSAKVGLATLVSMGAIGVGFGWLTGINLGPAGYDFVVSYHDVSGLTTGAGVMLMGVRVGKVVSIVPQNRVVLVHVHIPSPFTKIPKNDRFKIMSQGIIGEKSIEIFPPKEKKTVVVVDSSATRAALAASTEATPAPVEDVAYLGNNGYVVGDDPERLELVMEEMTDTFNEFRKGTDPAKFQALFAQTANNLLETTSTIKRIGTKAEGLMNGLDRTPKAINDMLASINHAADSADHLLNSPNSADIKETVTNLNRLSRGLMVTYRNFFGSEQQQANDKTLGTVRSLAQQLNELATTLNRTAGDPNMQNDLKDTIKNIRTLTQALSGAANPNPGKGFGGLPSFTLSPRVQALAANTPDGTGVAANLGMHLNFGNNYFNGGIEQIGSGNYLDLGFGTPDAWRGLGYQVGLIRSKIGVGVDYGLMDGVRLSGELYDTFHPTMRLGATYFPLVDRQYGLVGQWARTFDQNTNYLWLGLEWRPNF